MAFFSWSKTSSANATADSTIGWAEGQAPSSVNDSARAMMARLAEWRDDINGSIQVAGTATAYTLTSNQVFDSVAHLNHAEFSFIVATTNGAGVTLNVDGLGAFPLTTDGTPIPAGSLVSGSVYTAAFYTSVNEFRLRSFYINPYNTPIGGMMDYIGTTAPNSNFVFPIGQAISRTTYATLFALTSTTYGVGDGSTTFNVPDLTGRTVAMKEASATRLTTAGGGVDGGTLGAVGGTQNGTIAQGNLPAATLATTIVDPGHSHTAPGAFDSVSGAAGATFVRYNTSDVSPTITKSNATGITASTALGGSGTAFKLVQPTIILNKILRIL